MKWFFRLLFSLVLTVVVVNASFAIDVLPAQVDWAAVIIGILTPIVVYGATWVVVRFAPKLSGSIIVGVIVPVLTAISTGLTQLAGVNLSPILQVTLGLLAVFISQLQIQLRKAKEE